ncbi:MAG: ATP synthase F1 subunit delta, partial [Desulfuromonadales bacterium]|nr:ATP synthase F1 subunit delta [Desulfuromonadales bacterium]NIS42201.1 ATP synthase F1 subunit delta [Desulfuromonadales bacterium]
MSTSAISKRYAKALVSLGSEQEKVEAYGEELAQVSRIVASEDLLRLLVESPTLAVDKKSAIFAEIMDKLGLSDGMRDFLGLLVEKDRMQYLPQIEQKYQQLADELSGTLRANVTAAAELSDQQKTAISAELEKQTGKKVELTVDVDAALIGGLRTEIGGRLFDGSVKTQLKRIEDTLTK